MPYVVLYIYIKNIGRSIMNSGDLVIRIAGKVNPQRSVGVLISISRTTGFRGTEKLCEVLWSNKETVSLELLSSIKKVNA